MSRAHTQGLRMFLWRGLLAPPPLCIMSWACSPRTDLPDCRSLTQVALSVAVSTCISVVLEQPPTPPIRRPSRPRSSRAQGLRSPSPSFRRGFTYSLWKFTAWLGGKERKIRTAQGRLGSQVKLAGKKKKRGKKWCKFRRRIASRQGTELKESLSARHRLWGSIYLFVIFLSKCIVLFFCWQTQMVGGNY